MRRKERQQSPEWAYELLRQAEYATLCTIGTDGAPYSVPISPVLIGNDLYFHCAQEGLKYTNIKNDGRVCISCVGKTKVLPEKFTTEYESAIATGHAAFIEDESLKREVLVCLCEKYSPTEMHHVHRVIDTWLKKTAVCQIKLSQITGKANQNSQ